MSSSENRRDCGSSGFAALFLCGYAFAISASAAAPGSGSAATEDFVPFVIPATAEPNSPMAVTAVEPIGTDAERLVARSEHFYQADKRVRLWGVNLSFGANLPTHEDAPRVAARLAAAGVNSVRCHHLDTARWPSGIWNARDGKDISDEALDRLDYFIDQLARRGIWVNLNLHVGRSHSEYLGLPKTSREYDKISNLFTPALIEAQKGYARQILGHVNKYRKVRYGDDPVVAIVEITNENSLFMWGAEQTLRTLPPYYADILRGRFNAWLKGCYGSDDKLRRAWSKGASDLGDNVLRNAELQMADSADAISLWYVEQHASCRASASRQSYKSKDALRIAATEIDDTAWHLQLNQSNVVVKEGQYYTVIFQAAADKSRTLSCSVGQAHEPWANLGLSREVELAEDWRTFRFGFVAGASDDNARVSLAFGGSKVPFYLARVELRPGGLVGLGGNESIGAGSVAVFTENESPERVLDRMRFLAETEKAYFDGMRSFIRSELGCKALVTGTIVFGPLGLYGQSDMDFIDTHAYWQHPRFPGRPWDPANWLIDQKPMTDFPEQATVFPLAAARLAGKPFTLSEYNHPAPLDSQAECVPMIASFAAAQDWDGVWLYTYSHTGDSWDRAHMSSYFDVDTNPAKWAFMRAGAAIFRFGGVAPLDVRSISLARPGDLVTSLAQMQINHGTDTLAAISSLGNLTRQDMLRSRIVLEVNQPYRGLREPSDTRLDWSVENDKGFYAVFGQKAWIMVGHAGRFVTATRGHVAVDWPVFVAVTVTSLDDRILQQSRRVLVTACGRCENSGMEFSADRRTVGRSWGSPPVRIEPVRGTLELRLGKWTCRALRPDGAPGEEVAVSYRDNIGVFQILPRYKTMWYLLERYDKSD